jgi:thiol:disulfide interchange protein
MRFFLVVFALFSALTSFGQIENPVEWNMNATKVADGEYDLIYKAKIDDGWFVYSQYLESDEGPIPTTFEYDADGHYQLEGKSTEKGGRYEGMDPVFQMNVIKFKKDLTITQRVKVSDASQAITGYFTFMTCDDTKCLPPTDVDFSFDLSKIAAASQATEKTGEAESATAQATETTQAEAEEDEETSSDNASGMIDPVKWSFSREKISDTEYDLIWTATMDENWTIYSQFTSDDGPVPTFFYFDESDHYTREGKVEEKGKKKEGPDPLFDNVIVIKYVEKPVTFRQRVVVTDVTKPITGAVEFMTCDDERCLPPKEVPFSFDLQSDEVATAESDVTTDLENLDLSSTPFNEVGFNYDDSESECGNEEPEEEKKTNFWWIFVLGFGGGLFAILTPCVFPMIPLTVSFFTKSSTNRAKGISNAITYGLSIIVIYVALGLIITGIFGADALNLLSTNAWFNIFFAVLFIVFAFSFFGFFEITLPSSWSNRSDRAADRGGLIGIFFMAFTLSLVSFSCTGPIIGTLLVETATGGGPTLFGRIPFGPLVGMFGFSFALALPFALFAAFPSWLNSLPKSGGWMNSVKVTLGFVEIALAFKFLSVADLTMGWKILPYEAFLAIWVVCGLGLILYYLGILRFPHDGPRKKLSPSRGVLAAASLALVVYFTMGFRYSDQSQTFITPNLLSGVAPPAGHSYIYPKECPQNIDCYKDFFTGLEKAKELGKPILLDFTGHGCVNCRRMEDNVWGQDGVLELIRDEYVLISLYVDDRKKLENPYMSAFSNRQMRTVGNQWADFQAIFFQRNSQPYYVLLSDDLEILNQPVAYTPDKEKYQSFLECGLMRYDEGKSIGKMEKVDK